MTAMQTLLTNATIYDGAGGPPCQGDLLIERDRIAAVGPRLVAPADAQVIDLQGLSAAPGFIDAHSHNDWFAIKQDPLPYFEPFIRQGITSFVTGNCGLSAAGFDPASPYASLVGGGLFHFDNTTGPHGAVADFFDAVDGRMPCNLATLVGHGTARAGIAGNANRPLNEEELQALLSSLEQSLQQGACGISLGLMYEPGLYAPLDELTAVARLCARYGRPFSVHPRACSAVSMSYPQLLGRPHILRALDELVQIAQGTRLKLQYSHLIFVGRRSFACKEEMLRLFDSLRRQGVDACFDLYDETLGVSVITVVMPAWYQALSAADKRKPFNKLRFSLLANISCKLLGFGFDDIQIAWAGEGNECFEGKTVRQIARELGKSDIDAYLDVCETSHFQGRVNMGPYSTEQIIQSLSRHDHALYMTDAWVEDHGVQNPAVYDCFPKFLQRALQGRGDSLPRTVRKMSGAVADRYGLTNRGYLRAGAYADITVFDQAQLLQGRADCGQPFGICRVWVNGIQALDNQGLNRQGLQTSGRAMRV